MTDDPEGVRSAYDAVADAYADRLAAGDAESGQEGFALRQFLALLPPGGRVLDAGSGPGRLFPLLAGRDRTVVGIDLSAAMVRRSRSDFRGLLSAVGSVTALPFPPCAFDGYVSWFVTIHLDDAAVVRALCEARRVLRDGGVAALAFQTGDRWRDLAPVYRELGHEVRLGRWSREPSTVLALARAVGFELVGQHEVPPREEGSDGRAVLILSTVAGATPVGGT